jgi:D-xylose 1-dehydrogenase
MRQALSLCLENSQQPVSPGFCLSRVIGPGHGKSMNVPEFQGQTVLVTGGANGIGESIVRLFHARGASVGFCDKDERGGLALAAELGARATFEKVDLTREKAIARWIRASARLSGRIDVLTNNAGRDPRIQLKDTSIAEWDALFAVNLRAYFLTCRAAVEFMKPGASIINLASITFHQGPPNMTAYVATKGGIIGFTRSLARELGSRGIRVNTVSPGWVMTERQLRQFVTPAIRRMVKKSQCIPELLQPEEIAEIVLFLGSNASRAMTGQELLADRGWCFS